MFAIKDHDGSHIKGLIINLFDHFWPSLLKAPGFLLQFITPIVKVRPVYLGPGYLLPLTIAIER